MIPARIVAVLFVFSCLSGVGFCFVPSQHFIDNVQVSTGQNVQTNNLFEYKIVIFNNDRNVSPQYGYGYGAGKAITVNNPMVCNFVLTPAGTGQYAGQLIVNGVGVPDKNNELFFVNPAPVLPVVSSVHSVDNYLYIGQPPESPLVVSCVSDWNCSVWSDCGKNGLRSRNCTDNADCNVLNGKPRELQTCFSIIAGPNGNVNDQNNGYGETDAGNQVGLTGFFGFTNGSLVGGFVVLLLLLGIVFRKRIAGLGRKKS